ncbi:MAG: hypothetical protein M9894_16520 [Planctomycetes bacterium]|nr:hypothetical protein [Planctomycetota bacterium]
MTPRAVLVRAAARGLVFGAPPALLAALAAWAVQLLSTPPPWIAALEAGAPFAAAAAACAAVEFGWPTRGAQRHDLAAALLVFLVGPLAAVAAALQVEYAVGVLTGWIAVLDFSAVPTARVSEAIFKAGLLSFVLAVGALSRRRGDPGVVGCGGIAAVAIVGTSAALLLEVLVTISSEQPPPDLSSRVLELAVACVALAAVATVLCAVADAITGGWAAPPQEQPRDAAV